MTIIGIILCFWLLYVAVGEIAAFQRATKEARQRAIRAGGDRDGGEGSM